METKRYFKITNGNSIILSKEQMGEFLDDILTDGHFEESEYSLEVVEMTEHEFKNLPEFDGF